MKKLFGVLVFATVFFAIIRILAVDSVDAEYFTVTKALYDVSAPVKRDDFYTAADNVKMRINYTNAKSTDKYRFIRILEVVENEHKNTNAENDRTISDAVRFELGKCGMYNGELFYAKIRRIYGSYISVADSTEGSCSPLRRIGNTTYVREIFRNGSGKYTVDTAGNLWVYGKNYFCVVDENDFPIFAALDIGANGSGIEKRLMGNVFFKCGKIRKTSEFSEGNVERFRLSSEVDPERFISFEKDNLLCRLFFIEFNVHS